MNHPRTRTAKAVDRRDFLKTSVAAAVGTAAAGSRVVAASESSNDTEPIATRPFGKTGWKMPILAYGGAALPKVWLNPLSTEDRVKLVRYAYDQGLRYFDTAGNYMESQSILGEGLKDVRDDVYLVTKVETTNPDKVRAAVEKSLRELQTDHVDAILIHGTPGIEQMSVERAMEIHGELVKLQAKGITKFIGLSAHSYFDKALALISTGEFDLCMLAYGHIPRGHNQTFSPRMLKLRDACLAKAHELDMGIAAMKVVGAGMLGAWAGYVVPGFELHFRRSGGEGDQGFDECLDFAIVWGARQSGEEFLVQHFSGNRTTTVCVRWTTSRVVPRAIPAVGEFRLGHVPAA